MCRSKSHRCTSNHMPVFIHDATDDRVRGGAMPTRPRGPDPVARRAAQEELKVRRAAQQTLATHLTLQLEDPDGLNWPDLDLHLSQAYLLDFVLSPARLRNAIFTGAQFDGQTSFDGTRFGLVSFRDAVFHGKLRCAGITVTRIPDFRRARFAASAQFAEACFQGPTLFEGAALARIPSAMSRSRSRYCSKAPISRPRRSSLRSSSRCARTSSTPRSPALCSSATPVFAEGRRFSQPLPVLSEFTPAEIQGAVAAPVEGELERHLSAVGWTPAGPHDKLHFTPNWIRPDAIRIFEDDQGNVYLDHGGDTWQLGSLALDATSGRIPPPISGPAAGPSVPGVHSRAPPSATARCTSPTSATRRAIWPP